MLDGGKPELNDRVHYRSYGTPGGEYSSACRAAIVTEVKWAGTVDGPTVVGLCVLNPTGQFFNTGIRHDNSTAGSHAGGTWHRADECRER